MVLHSTALMLSPVQGWNWIGEIVKGPAQHPEQQEVQWGWVSHAVGDTMLIQVGPFAALLLYAR